MQSSLLVIDDSLTNIVLIEAILNREKIKVHKALTIDVSLEIIKKEKIDLIILDIMFPGKDGREFLRQRILEDNINTIPVIITSAINNQEEIEAIMALNINCFFKKPLEIELFLKKVKEYTNMAKK